MEIKSLGISNLNAHPDSYKHLTAWAMSPGRPKLVTLELRVLTEETFKILRCCPEVEHLKFGDVVHVGNAAPIVSVVCGNLDDLRLESLCVNTVHAVQDLTCLTRSSASTLRKLSLVWDRNVLPPFLDFSAFTSLEDLELKASYTNPSADFVPAFSTIASAVSTLAILSDSTQSFIDQDLALVAHHTPASVTILELPGRLEPDDLAQFVENLPASTMVRRIYARWDSTSSYLRGVAVPEQGPAKAACLKRGIGFVLVVRLLLLRFLADVSY